MLVQAAFYVSAVAGWILSRFGLRGGPLALAYYFVLANVAILVAFVKHLRGENHVVWDPQRGTMQSSKRVAAAAETGSVR